MNSETPALPFGESEVHLTRDQLPLCCPPRGVEVWDKHPRVWLPVTASGKAVCPYCSTRYLLDD